MDGISLLSELIVKLCRAYKLDFDRIIKLHRYYSQLLSEKIEQKRKIIVERTAIYDDNGVKL